MTAIATALRAPSRASAALAAIALGAMLSGCAEVGDTMSGAFADPARYELYDCKQLEPERRRLANALAENQGLMAKAETGVAGSVVAEIAYRNDYVAVRGQTKLADDAWRSNKCHDSPPGAEAPALTPAPLANAKGRRSPAASSGSAVY